MHGASKRLMQYKERLEFEYELPTSTPTTGELERTVNPARVDPLFHTLSYSYPANPGTDVPSANPVPA